MWEQIGSNRRRSVALTIGIGAILLVVGYLIGLYFFGNGYAGLIIALIFWGIMNLVALFQGDSILLSISKAKKIKKPVSTNLLVPQDRRIVHLTLRDDEMLTTKSRGEGLFKKVIIFPKS